MLDREVLTRVKINDTIMEQMDMAQHKNGSFSSSIWLTVPRMAIGLALTLFGAANALLRPLNYQMPTMKQM